MYTRYRRRSVSGDLLIDHHITRYSSDLPDNHLMEVRGINVLAINRPVQSSTGAYRWMERDQQGPGDVDKESLTK